MDMKRIFAPLSISRLAAALRRWSTSPPEFVYEPALRSELFSAEQMAEHGMLLARQHQLSPCSATDELLERLTDNEALLARSCQLLTQATLSTRQITPAAEWLLDNFYLIEEQIRTAQRHLPKGYSRELPRLAKGPSAGLSRVYDIALEIISHGDGRVDSHSLSRFIAAYQSVTPLTLGELWAIPIMLRLALIENLRRVASRVIANWNDCNLAETWADRLAEIAEQDAKSVVLTVADMARSAPPMSSSFVAELTRRLQGQNAALALPLTWIEQLLSASGLSIEHLVQLEAQQQAADQVSISHSIGSLRLLTATDWCEFVESMSIVEQTLRQDPAGVYLAMDFATRDHYRHVVERLARSRKKTEVSVAQAAIAMADEHPGGDDISRHVGFYLIDRGLPALQAQLGTRLTLHDVRRWLLSCAPLPIYLGLALLFTLALAWPFIALAQSADWPDYLLLVLALPSILMASQPGIGLVNWLVTLSVTPSVLPRMDFDLGIPPEARTLVVVPTLIGNAHDVDELVEGLEVRFLANRDQYLHFALLTDFLDAASEVLDSDAALLLLARQRVEALNNKYPDSNGQRFLLIHRPRRWNPDDKLWMGHERKRGKIAELNALLRGHGAANFALIVGDLQNLPTVRYVITLDTDTQLPRDTARQFIATMVHPLNHPVFDPLKQRVTRGYALLQPRVGISLPSTARSAYAQLFGSDAGIDPYTRSVSDVYQDFFQQGSFVGKGIYAIDAFELAVAERFADNSILSHDLIEGCFARAGLLSDVQLYEEYPARYSADVNRRHRWIRGDWQLLPWLFPWAPTRSAGIQSNPLCSLSRWKIADNLRRSLAPSALLSLFVLGWCSNLNSGLWTLALLVLTLSPALLHGLLALAHKPAEMSLKLHLKTITQNAGQHLLRSSLALVWLPHEVFYSLDAILRTLWRMLISRRRLLQWNPSREVERTSTSSLKGLYRLMWVAPLLAVLLPPLLWAHPLTLAYAGPLLLLWLLSPTLAWWISRPPSQQAFVPTVAELSFLRALARRTWAFFDVYVGPEDNWLPPDNMQEHPLAVVAHRTSPTNMGMALLAHLAAHDFGYLSGARLLQRLDQCLASMARLERHRRHFYNWYDTQTLQPLPPYYVSTVDSGNLAGHLLTLRPGLLGLLDEPVFTLRQLDGLADSVQVLRDAMRVDGQDSRILQALQQQLNTLQSAPPQSLQEALWALQNITELSSALASQTLAPPLSDSSFWLQALQEQCNDLHSELARFILPANADSNLPVWPSWRQLANLDCQRWPEAERELVHSVQHCAQQRIASANRLGQQAGAMADMDFAFLYDQRRDLFAIGYNVEERRLDSGYYDLLASEVRLTNFVAIAQGQLPQQSWFTLGRLLTANTGVPVLLSWTGSMFEYLMPMLVMPSYAGTLLEQTCHAAVARQIEYGNQLGLPWGVSESAYNVLDGQLNYQYRAFGVPGLGLKRGLGDDVVVAPYATALALMVAPQAACRNLQRLASEGLAGRFGLYEAVDYTVARLPRGQSSMIIRSFMAHHQGMSLLALASVLLDRPMQRRFESEPQFQAITLLLQERIPKTATPFLHATTLPTLNASNPDAQTRLRVITDPNRQRPSVQLLSNGRYHVMVSSAGGGYSRCRELAVTRWHEDISADNWGMFCYLRDVASGQFWSSAHQPTLKQPECYEAIFSDARAEFRVRERDFDAHTEIVVSPEDDIELRRITLTNRARVRRTIELTSYAEVVLAPAIADAMHPAFSNLFVQTELVPALQAIICTRRPRSSTETVPWMCHLLAAHGADIESISYETDRSRFIGRGRSLTHPAAMDDNHAGRLSNSEGSVLDPVVAIRCRISLDAGQSASIDLVTGMSNSRDGCLQLIGKYRDRYLADRVFDLAWTHSQVLLRQLNALPADARLYEQMAASLVYASTALRAESSILSSNQRNQSGLWGQAISGDLPIVLVQIYSSAQIELVRQLVQAHAYWRQKGLAVDLVIWNEDQAGYRQQLQDLIMGLITSGIEANLVDRPGGIFVRSAKQLSPEDRILMQAVARIVLAGNRGSLHEQVHRRRVEAALPRFDPSYLSDIDRVPTPLANPDPALLLGNAYGGFSADGSEYVITLRPGETTPAPWANVLANPQFGSVISESGSAYTWSNNAHEYRLTPWQNDPVGDNSGEALYLRDEDSGYYWSPTPLPRRGNGTYVTRHGFGYSVFEHEEDGIYSELWVYVALDTPVKFSVLKLHNRSGRARRLSATGYVEWVLGDLREKTAMHVVSESDPISGALFARNAYSMEYSGRVAFFDVDWPGRSISGDRCEFLGRNGNLRAPAAMSQPHLSGRVGAGLDPCGAIQIAFELADGAHQEIIFRLGAEQDARAATGLVHRLRGAGSAASALLAVRKHWQETLGKVQVQTPDPAVNVLVNGWLMYQVIACRFWARSGYYQSGGAFGFRDQLQDTLAMLHAAPATTREHLLLCAAHQFIEGDVQHWWHPPQDRGVRTHCSDDYLWLPLVTSRYVQVSGDRSVLDEPASYLEGRALNQDEESYFDLPKRSALRESLYQHCVRAIEHGLQRGAHGLPLMGSGDWNDGMNRVGEHGQGESIWLGFFQYQVLRAFAGTAREHGDDAFARRCEEQAQLLQANLESNGWDGAWYRRAYFDDGTPLGSASNDECQIDSIAQSWAVLSGAAPEQRRHSAMQALDQHLVRRDLGLIQLFEPPFDKSALEPGYIKGYVPGVRENGGQYTHAGIWAAMAFAELGDSAKAWELTRMLNPLSHGQSTAAVQVYKVEPYVISADIYAVAPHAGRGGWSWYTGSAGWMYQLLVESLLGLHLEGARLQLRPVLPADWPGFSLDYRFGSSLYQIVVQQSAQADNTQHVSLDGVLQPTAEVLLIDDGQPHRIDIRCAAS